MTLDVIELARLIEQAGGEDGLTHDGPLWLVPDGNGGLVTVTFRQVMAAGKVLTVKARVKGLER